MKPAFALRNFLIGASMLAAGTMAAQAAAYTWNGSAGLWSTTTAWTPTSTGLTSADDLTFDSAGTGSLTTALGGADQTAKSITFHSSSSYTVRLYSSTSTTTTARQLTLSGGITVSSGNHSILGNKPGSGTNGSLRLATGTFNIASGSTLTFDTRAGQSGTSSYTKSGAGTLVFNADNGGSSGWSHSGLAVNAGILQFSASGAFGNSGNDYTVASGAALEITGGVSQTNTTGIITLNGTGISGNGALRSLGGTNALNSTGSIVLNTVGTNSIGVDAGSLSIANVISGTSSTRNFTKAGAGTLALSGANTFSGTTTISAGTISAANIVVSGGSSNLGNATSAVTLGSAGSQGTLSYTGNSATYTRGFTIGGAGGGRLDVTSSGQTLSVDTGAVTGSGLFTVGGAGNTTINSNLTHTGGLTKADAGTLTLAGTNIYDGATTVSGGTLVVSAGNINGTSGITIDSGAHFKYNSSTALTKPITNNGGTISGTGTISVDLGLNSTSDVISPGNSPGVQPYGADQTWSSMTYLWETNNFTGTTAGTHFDQIAITGNLSLTGAAPGSYLLDLVSLTAGNTAGDVPNFSESNRAWDILTTTGTISGFNPLHWTIDTSGLTTFTSSPSWTGTWGIGLNGTNNALVLTYTAIPEPAASLLGALGLLVLLRRRR